MALSFSLSLSLSLSLSMVNLLGCSLIMHLQCRQWIQKLSDPILQGNRRFGSLEVPMDAHMPSQTHTKGIQRSSRSHVNLSYLGRKGK